MSHFVTAVLVDTPDMPEAEAQVDALLAPYSEDLEMPPYMVPCWCLKSKKRETWLDDPEAGSVAVEVARDKCSNQEEFDVALEPILARRDELEATVSGAMEDCEECGGTGEMETTSNPKAKWDWYTLGGRWRDLMGGRVIVPSVEFDSTPFAVVTPDGEWHEKGQIGWFAMVSDEKERVVWEKEAKEILAKYPGHMVAIVDVHI